MEDRGKKYYIWTLKKKVVKYSSNAKVFKGIYKYLVTLEKIKKRMENVRTKRRKSNR